MIRTAHLSLNLLRDLLDPGLAVHGEQVQLLVYELQSVLAVLFGLKAVGPTKRHQGRTSGKRGFQSDFGRQAVMPKTRLTSVPAQRRTQTP